MARSPASSSRAAASSSTEEYLEGDADTLRNTRSCTKTVASMLTGIEIERGLVRGVESSLVELLGARVDDPRKRAITVRDVLTMSSCLDCDDWDEASPGNEELMYPQEDWLGFALGLPVREGTGFSYCTAGVVVLGVALEQAAGGSLPDFARSELSTRSGSTTRNGRRRRSARSRAPAASS